MPLPPTRSATGTFVVWRLLDGRGREQVVERHALPERVELRPFCDAMNVRLDCGLGERLEFSPCPLAELQSVELKRKSPVFQCDLRSRSRRQNWEIRGHILSGRYPVGQTFPLSSRPEAAGNRGLGHAGSAFSSGTHAGLRSSRSDLGPDGISDIERWWDRGPARRKSGAPGIH